MEIPFYYSFAEFQENYNNDLKNWLEVFKDADETNFLNELKVLYRNFVVLGNFDHSIEFQYMGESGYPEYFESDINLYSKTIVEQTNKFINENEFLDKNADYNYLDYWDNFNSFAEVFICSEVKHKYYKHFFTSFYPICLKFDEIKYKNFQFSVVNIAKLIDSKILKFTMEIPETETNISDKPETKISEITEKGNNLNFKIAMLEYMDVLKWLENNIPNQTNRAEILAKLIGGSTATIEDYLSGKNPIKTDIRQRAMNFINDKRYNLN